MPYDNSTVGLLYLLLSSTTLLIIVCGLVFWYMISHGYKSIVIKFKKDTKLLKQIKKNQKYNEDKYLSVLENNLKKNNKSKKKKFKK
jgi:predicted RNA-binding protein associated with RNAse of E/G family